MGKVKKELIGATAIKLILSILALDDCYGYDMVQKVNELSNGKFKWNVASIYPVLKKMEEQDFIKSYWRMEINERPRKYYQIKVAGKKELEKEKGEWNLVNSVLTQLWESEEKMS